MVYLLYVDGFIYFYVYDDDFFWISECLATTIMPEKLGDYFDIMEKHNDKNLWNLILREIYNYIFIDNERM